MTMSMTFTLRFSCHFVFCYDWWSETYKTMSKEPIEPYLADAWHRRGFLSTVFVGLNPVTRLLFFTLMLFYLFFLPMGEARVLFEEGGGGTWSWAKVWCRGLWGRSELPLGGWWEEEGESAFEAVTFFVWNVKIWSRSFCKLSSNS